MQEAETEVSSGFVYAVGDKVVIGLFAYTEYGHSRVSDALWILSRNQPDEVRRRLRAAVEGGRPPPVEHSSKPGTALQKALGRKSWKTIHQTCAIVHFDVYDARVVWIPYRPADDGRGSEPMMADQVTTERSPDTDYVAALQRVLARAEPTYAL